MQHLISKRNIKQKKAIHSTITCEDYACMNTCGGSCEGKLVKIK